MSLPWRFLERGGGQNLDFPAIARAREFSTFHAFFFCQETLGPANQATEPRLLRKLASKKEKRRGREGGKKKRQMGLKDRRFFPPFPASTLLGQAAAAISLLLFFCVFVRETGCGNVTFFPFFFLFPRTRPSTHPNRRRRRLGKRKGGRQASEHSKIKIEKEKRKRFRTALSCFSPTLKQKGSPLISN